MFDLELSWPKKRVLMQFHFQYAHKDLYMGEYNQYYMETCIVNVSRCFFEMQI